MVDVDENPFDEEDSIFEQKQPLKTDTFTPETIFHRDDEIELYINALQDVVVGHAPNNVFVYGPTGVGKTAVTKWVRDKLQEKADSQDVPLTVLGPINCRNYKSSYALVTSLVNEFRHPDDQLPESGYSTDRVFEFLYQEIEAVGGNVLIILDEIDNIGHSDDILYGLPRARSNGYVDDVRPVIVGISNDFQFRDNLSPKVKDTLAEKEILFPPYDANQLRSILNPRAEKAFHDDVLTEDVVPLCAAFAAQDTGSARQAIRLLREAGELAQAADSDTVTEGHVRDAQDELEKNQLYEGMQELTTQGHAVLCALAYHQALDDVPIRSRSLYERYVKICDRLDADSVSERRVRDHLSDMNMLGLISVYERNEGLSAGRYHEYELDVPLKAVLEVLLSTTRFEELANIIESTADDNNLLQSDISDY